MRGHAWCGWWMGLWVDPRVGLTFSATSKMLMNILSVRDLGCWPHHPVEGSSRCLPRSPCQKSRRTASSAAQSGPLALVNGVGHKLSVKHVAVHLWACVVRLVRLCAAGAPVGVADGLGVRRDGAR